MEMCKRLLRDFDLKILKNCGGGQYPNWKSFDTRNHIFTQKTFGHLTGIEGLGSISSPWFNIFFALENNTRNFSDARVNILLNTLQRYFIFESLDHT